MSRTISPFFSDGNLQELLARVHRQGGWYESLVTPFLTLWYKAFLGQMAFVYFILYFTLPGYTSEKRNKFSVTLITLSFILIFLSYQYWAYYTSYQYGTKTGVRPRMPNQTYILAVLTKNLSFVLPTLTGIGITIKILKRLWIKQREAQQFAAEKATMELNLLRAQIHPHFLFNTLNNIYSIALTEPVRAPEMIKRLSSMLHYILNECDQPKVPLERELKMIRDYMALERIRYGDEMEMNIDIRGEWANIEICPLLLIPFVENSFKHGASKILEHSFVNLFIGIKDNVLFLQLSNNMPEPGVSLPKNGSIGLKNVRKRLELLYPQRHELKIIQKHNRFDVSLSIELADPQDLNSGYLQRTKYELA